MEQTSAQRRLVKSPPELWARLSDEVTLAGHLAEFGEIRITRIEPETTVAWEGDRASGTVELEPSGWGTKVVLTATPAPPAVAPPPAAQAPPAAAQEERSFVAPAAVEEVRPALPVAEPPRAEPPRAARPGRWARLLRSWARRAPAPVGEIPGPPAPSPDPEPPVPRPDPSPPPGPPAPGPQPVPDPQPPAPGPGPGPDPQPPVPPPDPSPPVIGPPPPEPLPPAAGEPPLDPERARAVLTGVLDDLGAAHHRPFSRE